RVYAARSSNHGRAAGRYLAWPSRQSPSAPALARECGGARPLFSPSLHRRGGRSPGPLEAAAQVLREPFAGGRDFVVQGAATGLRAIEEPLEHVAPLW